MSESHGDEHYIAEQKWQDEQECNDPDRQRDEQIQQAWETYESARDEKRQKDMWAMIGSGDLAALAKGLQK